MQFHNVNGSTKNIDQYGQESANFRTERPIFSHKLLPNFTYRICSCKVNAQASSSCTQQEHENIVPVKRLNPLILCMNKE